MPVAATGASGSVTLTPKPWGTAIVLDLKQLPAEGVFTLRTMDDSGQMRPAATWAAMPTGKGGARATSIPMPKLRKLNIVDANNTVLATVERWSRPAPRTDEFPARHRSLRLRPTPGRLTPCGN